jgi:hypothetical protein
MRVGPSYLSSYMQYREVELLGKLISALIDGHKTEEKWCNYLFLELWKKCNCQVRRRGKINSAYTSVLDTKSHLGLLTQLLFRHTL